MSQYLRAYAERAAEGGGEMGSPIRFIASTENVARDGMVIPADAWQLDNFRLNPVVLFSHDYFSRPPIGKVTKIDVEDSRLMAEVIFDQGDEFAVSIERKVRSGIMSACSVGWDTLSFEPPKGANTAPRVTKADLLDFSIVPVPSDPGALKVRQQRGLEAMARDILKAIEPESATDPESPAAITTPTDPTPNPSDTARATWDETAPQMVRLFTPFAQRPDEERKADYNRLAREYARHRKTPPEFLPQADLDALGMDEVRGLFLEGEAETFADVFALMGLRAGAMLSQKNLRSIDGIRGMAMDIVAACDDMMESAKKQAKDDTTDEERGVDGPLSDLAKLMGIAA